MLPRRFSLLRPDVLAGVLVLSSIAVPSAFAQAPAPTGSGGQLPSVGGQPFREPGSITPEIYEAGGPQQRTSTGQASSQPWLTPGYFDVVCPAMCFGAAFHVCGERAFGGAGYYGPFRRLWGYGTYGPNFNVGPESPQFGLIGCEYVAMQAGHGHCGKYSHPHCYWCGSRGNLLCLYGDGGVPPPSAPPGTNPPAPPAAKGPAQPPAEELPPPTPDGSAHLRLLVPENAEVTVEGRKTVTTGSVRDFVSPRLAPGKSMVYSIVVRYSDASGKPIEETHSIRVRANDRLNIDCTKPTGAEPPRVTAQRP
jgi:uncharacterized protein (TIGR03000 family)